MRNGILAGGNWIIDQVKVIDRYPSEEKLANILEEFRSNGGSSYTVLKDLYKIGVSFPLEGVGLIGDDERGYQILKECHDLSINTAQLRMKKNVNTSYTDVMSVRSTGKRTFFHNRGANALLEKAHFDFSKSQAKIFHLGYLLLLDELDKIEPDGSTGSSILLKRAKEHGFITSVDIVSEDSTRFKEIVSPSLPFIDYLFMNEFEAKMLTGIDTCNLNGRLSVQKCFEAAEKVIELGVQKWVIIHFPEGAIALSHTNKSLFQPSIDISEEETFGSVGAGDAFAAGVLTGMHENWTMERSLELGVCVAASSLFSVTASGSIKTCDECLNLAKLHGYRKEFQQYLA